MRMRIISVAVVVLGLGIVGIALAQQAGQRPRSPAGEKERLRAQVARLQAEAEFQQMDHDVDTAFLKTLLTNIKNDEEPGPPGYAASLPTAPRMAARRLLERLSKEFVEKSATMNETKLKLAEVEKRYNEAQ